MANTLIQHSKTAYTAESANLQVLNAGSLQRIADATERMATNYLKLQYELEEYKQLYKRQLERNEVLKKRLSAQKGVITKLKTKLIGYSVEIDSVKSRLS